MKRVSRFLLFAWTLLSSAWNQYAITGQVRWRALPAIVTALWSSPKVDRRPGSEWWRRMRGCQRCSLYDRRRRACGHLGMTYQRGGVLLPLGCSCFMPLKSAASGARCWLWEETGGMNGEDWTPR